MGLQCNRPNPKAEVLFFGLAPGRAGVPQVNFREPGNLAEGTYRFSVTFTNSLCNVVSVPVRP